MKLCRQCGRLPDPYLRLGLCGRCERARLEDEGKARPESKNAQAPPPRPPPGVLEDPALPDDLFEDEL